MCEPSVSTVRNFHKSTSVNTCANFPLLTASLNQAVLNNFQHNARNIFVRTFHLPLNLCCEQTCTLCQIFHSVTLLPDSFE